MTSTTTMLAGAFAAVAALAVAPTAFAQAAPATKPIATAPAVAPQAPKLRQGARVHQAATSDEDARKCLEFPDPRQIITCAEKYRH